MIVFILYLKNSPWGGSTNFQSAFDLILNMAVMFNVPPEQMPQAMAVLSDMQFNIADGNRTNWEEIERKYAAAGYRRPTIIFWNLSGSSIDYPVPHDKVPIAPCAAGSMTPSCTRSWRAPCPIPWKSSTAP